jgi:nucleoid-associated protein YgaU
MQSGQDTRAEIINLDDNTRLKCHFSPNTYTFDKKNNWPADQKSGGDVPKINFGGGSPATLTMELMFDTYTDAQPDGKAEDVRTKYTDKLWALMLVKKRDKKSKKGRPPRVKFIWGKTWSFEGVITSLTQKFVLFLDTGIPVRATVNVTFQQWKDEEALAKQNPTSGGLGGDRVWTVVEGDTLGWIAYQEYGDSAKWRLIADANHLDGVRSLPLGAQLVIPNG